jgi:flavin-binding protein dodecin
MSCLFADTAWGVTSTRAGQYQPDRSAIPLLREVNMSVAKVTEISCASPKSFEDAIEKGIERADKTLDRVKGAWVSEMKVEVDDGKVSAYRVNLKVTFILKD